MNGAWGTICDNEWDLDDAKVVCRQLGYDGADSASSWAEFGQGSGDIVYTKVDCDGWESKLKDCSLDKDTVGCFHTEDARVTCKPHHEGNSRVTVAIPKRHFSATSCDLNEDRFILPNYTPVPDCIVRFENKGECILFGPFGQVILTVNAVVKTEIDYI